MKNEVRAKDKNEKKAVVRQDNGINSSIESNLESRFSMKLNCIWFNGIRQKVLRFHDFNEKGNKFGKWCYSFEKENNN